MLTESYGNFGLGDTLRCPACPRAYTSHDGELTVLPGPQPR
jgi:hypothetical protein